MMGMNMRTMKKGGRIGKKNKQHEKQNTMKDKKQNTTHEMNNHNKKKKTKTQKQKNNTARFIPRTRCWSASSRAPTFGGLLFVVRSHHTATERKPPNVYSNRSAHSAAPTIAKREK